MTYRRCWYISNSLLFHFLFHIFLKIQFLHDRHGILDKLLERHCVVRSSYIHHVIVLTVDNLIPIAHLPLSFF